jgi:flavin reductase (DIM6/NTAB) family NADH-FMN oxidoreductase RutF
MIDTDTFRSALARFASGVAIITARDGDRDVGMTVSAFSSLSLLPPLVLLCVGHSASMHDLLLGLPNVGINILASGQETHSRRFANHHDRQRFEGISFSRGQSEVALFDDALAQLECRLVRHYEVGDHTIFVAEVQRVALADGRPLLYYRGSYAMLEA